MNTRINAGAGEQTAGADARSKRYFGMVKEMLEPYTGGEVTAPA
jgi:hypothetical protein